MCTDPSTQPSLTNEELPLLGRLVVRKPLMDGRACMWHAVKISVGCVVKKRPKGMVGHDGDCWLTCALESHLEHLDIVLTLVNVLWVLGPAVH